MSTNTYTLEKYKANGKKIIKNYKINIQDTYLLMSYKKKIQDF